MKSPFGGSVIPTPYNDPSRPMPAIQFDRSIDKLPDSGPGGGGGQVQFPFQLQKVGTTKINVRYGTLQDVEPTNCETDIDISATNGTWTFYLDLEIDINGTFVAATLSHATTGQPADSDYHGYITLGVAVVAANVITSFSQAATHSLRFAMCGRVVTSGTLVTRGTYEFWGF